MSRPRQRTTPERNPSVPASTRNNVDLPAPFRPNSATTDPGGNLTVTPWSTSTGP